MEQKCDRWLKAQRNVFSTAPIVRNSHQQEETGLETTKQHVQLSSLQIPTQDRQIPYFQSEHALLTKHSLQVET